MSSSCLHTLRPADLLMHALSCRHDACCSPARLAPVWPCLAAEPTEKDDGFPARCVAGWGALLRKRDLDDGASCVLHGQWSPARVGQPEP